jgi:hypothetical protein
MHSHALAYAHVLAYADPMDHRGPRPRHLHGVDNAVDQVARQRAFEAAHPEWRISCDERLRWRAVRDGSAIAVEAYELRELLDELEGRYS